MNEAEQFMVQWRRATGRSGAEPALPGRTEARASGAVSRRHARRLLEPNYDVKVRELDPDPDRSADEDHCRRLLGIKSQETERKIK
jgi:hypothetical protein